MNKDEDNGWFWYFIFWQSWQIKWNFMQIQDNQLVHVSTHHKLISKYNRNSNIKLDFS